MAKVGIFYKVNNQILLEAIELDHAERYGNALGFGGHYEYWMKMTPSSLVED